MKIKLNFEIKCNDFDFSLYESGMPKEYRSSLEIIKDDETVVQKDIIVNDPLRYKGISFYQASYGNLPSNEVVLSFTNAKTGMSYKHNAKLNQPLQLPEKLGTFEIKNFLQSHQ